MKKLGLALGGGGSRALCHLGVLSVLKEEGIEISTISGSSMGGLIGAMYAFNPDADAVKEKAEDFFKNSILFGGSKKQDKDDGLRGGITVWKRVKKHLRTFFVFNVLALRSSLLPMNPMKSAVNALLPEADIKDTKIPLCCNALDMTEGKPVFFHEGSVRDAVLGGTTVAVVFAPYKWNGKHYNDAAPVSSIPVYSARQMGADVVLGIDIRTDIGTMPAFHTGFDVVSRVEMISSKLLNDREANTADILIKPDVMDFFWGDFSDVDTIVEKGAEAARAILPQLKEMLSQSNLT
jgi:NTE family protein